MYDPTEGEVFLNGKDLKSYYPEELSKKIGFILQEPFLFNGTVRDNILYGNEAYKLFDENQLNSTEKRRVESLVDRFENGLDTKIISGGGFYEPGRKTTHCFYQGRFAQT